LKSQNYEIFPKGQSKSEKRKSKSLAAGASSGTGAKINNSLKTNENGK
jgi:hypothetical protein